MQNPAVIRAHSEVGPDGVSTPPSADALQSECETVLQIVLGHLLSHDTILRTIARRKHTITLSGSQWNSTTNTYTFVSGDSVAEVIDVTIGTAKKPLRKFIDEYDYNEWYYNNVGSDDANAAVPDYAYGFYVFFQSADEWQLTFVPGVGDSTTADVWHITKLSTPYETTMLETNLHNLIYLAGVDFLTNGQFTNLTKELIGIVSRRVKPVKGGYQKIKHDPLVKAGLVSRNSQYSPLF